MPAVLVGTYGDDGTPNAMTAAWAAACCHQPPCVGVAIRQNRLTHANLVARRAFTICVPGTTLAPQVDYLGIVSGKREPDKLARLGLATVPCPTIEAPLIEACPVVTECRLHSQLEIGTHTWFVGEVVDVHVDAELVDADGKIDVTALDPLGYATSVGEYRALGGPLGRAYSIGKALKGD
jgi:flavin reductase (DIM6/NTAB) family NADH-FMN oxidoreductase RutF